MTNDTIYFLKSFYSFLPRYPVQTAFFLFSLSQMCQKRSSSDVVGPYSLVIEMRSPAESITKGI